MPSKAENRVAEFDILKGLGMLMVIIGHSLHIWPLYEIVYSIHMPLFFLVSGYFFSVKGTMGGVFVKNLKQLVLPYVFISIIICALFLFFREHGETIIYESLLGTTLDNDFSIVLGPVWFFLALFWCRTFYRFLVLYTNSCQRTIICFISAICLIIVNRCYDVYQIPYEITQGIVGMFYYHLGVFFRDNYQLVKSLSRNNKAMWAFVSLMVLLVSVSYYRRSGLNMNLSALKFPLAPIDLLNAGSLVISLIFMVEYAIRKGCCKKLSGFLSWFGKSSMTIYCIHCVEYHFTIPFVSYIANQHSTSLGLLRYAVICGNPLVQILICISGLYVYEWLKKEFVPEKAI